MARLYVLSGPDLGKSFDVAPGATLGRSTDCAIVLRDHSVSRQHARLECHDGHWSVHDLGSRNGLALGGAKTTRAELADGAEFQLGEVLIRFRADVESKPAPAPAPAPAPIAAPAVTPAPAAAEEEIVLEGEWEAPPAAPAPAPAAKPQPAFPKPASPSPELVRTARMPARGAPTGLEQRERGVLQYSKVENTGSFFQSELTQQPWYVQVGVWLLALALFAAIGWGAFHATSFFKAKVAGPAPEEAPADER